MIIPITGLKFSALFFNHVFIKNAMPLQLVMLAVVAIKFHV